MKEDYTGYWYCEKCNLKLKVVTRSHNQGWIYPRKINKCPQCKNDKIEIISKSDFDNTRPKLWFGGFKNNVLYSLKFGVIDED